MTGSLSDVTSDTSNAGVNRRPTVAVLVPIKSFDLAKGRLAETLSPAERATLARRMAERVLRSAAPLPAWVICDDDVVAAAALTLGAGVVWRPSRGLNIAVTEGRTFLADEGFDRVLVAHADLPLATSLAPLADGDGVTLVPDRRGDGSNVLVVPTAEPFTFHYGTGSAAAHEAEAIRRGLTFNRVEDDALGWDVDVPEDLDVPTGEVLIPKMRSTRA